MEKVVSSFPFQDFLKLKLTILPMHILLTCKGKKIGIMPGILPFVFRNIDHLIIKWDPG